MTIWKRRFSRLIAIILVLGIYSAMIKLGNASSVFAYKMNYDDVSFTDVGEDDWFYQYVKEAYQCGLMVGDSQTTFNPKGNVRICEIITIASRLHAMYYRGSIDFVQGTPWYQVFVDYAINNQILTEEYSDYYAPATRAEFAVVLSKALPDLALAEINHFVDGDVPDVSLADRYGEAVYKLYNAGILIGNDESGTFSPRSTIRRSEVAAIVSRMANPQLRLMRSHVPLNESDTSTSTETGITAPMFVVGSTEAARGDKSIPVHIMLKNNPGIASLALLVSYDNSLKLSSVKYNIETRGQTIEPEKMTNPIKLLWISPFEDIYGDWTLATLYFDIDPDAELGKKQIVIKYDADDVFNIREENVTFGTLNGGISVIQ